MLHRIQHDRIVSKILVIVYSFAMLMQTSAPGASVVDAICHSTISHLRSSLQHQGDNIASTMAITLRSQGLSLASAMRSGFAAPRRQFSWLWETSMVDEIHDKGASNDRSSEVTPNSAIITDMGATVQP